MIATATQDMQFVGLIIDAIGIAILGIPAMFRMTNEIAAQMGTYWDFNPPLAKALAKSRVDITVGSILLFAGFGIQLMGTLNLYFLGNAGLFVLVIVSASVATYWLKLREVMCNWLFESALNRNQNDQELAKAAADHV